MARGMGNGNTRDLVLKFNTFNTIILPVVLEIMV